MKDAQKLISCFRLFFLKKQENSAVFSPIGCDMNILVQCYDENFELKNKEKGREDLNFIKEQMRSVVSDTFDSFTCSYKRYELKQKDITYNGFIQAHYSKSNEQFVFKKHHEVSVESYAEQINKEHVERLKNKAQVFLSTPLKTSFFINNDKIYGTFVYCNEIWAKEFVKNTSSYNRFFLSDGRSSFRNFIKKNDFFKYEKITLNNLEFEIVAIPYGNQMEYKFTRYILYLIPSNHNTDLSKIWDAFYTFSNRNIRKVIKTLNMREIDLWLPTLQKFQSNLNLITLLYDVFKYNTAYNFFSSLLTYINIDENCDEENVSERDAYSNNPQVILLL